MEATIEDGRERLIKWVKEQLIGPTRYMDSKSEDEGSFLMGINPIDRFPCGAIYPVFEGEGEDPAIIEDGVIDELDDAPITEDGKESEPVRRYVPPSSIGISLCLAGSCEHIEVYFFAARYDHKDSRWIREELTEQKTFYAPTNDYGRDPRVILKECAIADILWRKYGDVWIVTISLCNNNSLTGSQYNNAKEFTEKRAEATLFEVRFEVSVGENELNVYPGVDKSLLDDEEQEIELQYRSQKEYAIGHGTGVNWEIEKKAIKITTDPIPIAETPQIQVDFGYSQGLEFRSLADALDNKDNVIGQLTAFVKSYEQWIENQQCAVAFFQEEDKSAGARIISRMHLAKKRMLAGIKLLSKDYAALRAFSLANRAILNQMMQVDKQKDKKPKDDYAWRPFQLAFLLTALESATNNESEHRDLVDLIWFPTGGGKTEAYFGLIAYVILLRRLKYPATFGGTTALMRYTLRLLTKDQFLRATRLICALELIRRDYAELGDEAISIGLWVGGEASPNSFREADMLVRRAKDAGNEPSLVVDQCPWCGTKFSIHSGNYVSSTADFYFRCTNRTCNFGHGEKLPCNIVDDYLYASPPTLIVGTIDKFARMPWESRVSNFFGIQGNRPPELIIQDELHLISGALGSISGLYEAAVDTIIKLRGLYPKYIASTATIRTAETQIKRLYGREAAVFPPPGIAHDDSYFAKTIPLREKPGRQYLGYYAPMLNRQKCLAPLAAALLAAPVALFTEDINKDVLLDAWWTSLVYHGSLKGLANSHMAFDSDVRERLRMIISEIKNSSMEAMAPGQAAGSKSIVVEELEKRVFPMVEELTSHKTAAENAATFSRLTVCYPEKEYLDVALATNMVSVGLDVSRLALMIVNGQPLTTAEYIQASSRVGRSSSPGIVFINYYRDQTRSLSHYEHFRAYHNAFYRYVEPTSVTPFTKQARNKALHAAVVSVMRHGIDGVDEASDFSTQLPQARNALKILKARCTEADSELSEKVCADIDFLADKWASTVQLYAAQRRNFVYYSNDNASENLLCNFDDKIQGMWQTLQSMRNVESTALLKEI